jgi:hypothetical protein
MQQRIEKQQLAQAFKQMNVKECVSQVSTMKYNEMADICLTYSKLEGLGLNQDWFKTDTPRANDPLRREARKQGINTIDGECYFFFQFLKPFYMQYLLEHTLPTQEVKKQPTLKI